MICIIPRVTGVVTCDLLTLACLVGFGHKPISIIGRHFKSLKRHFWNAFFSYTIVVAEQGAGEAFNRAKLFNVGYQELKVRLKITYIVFLLHFFDSTLVKVFLICNKSEYHLHIVKDCFQYHYEAVEMNYSKLSVGISPISVNIVVTFKLIKPRCVSL